VEIKTALFGIGNSRKVLSSGIKSSKITDTGVFIGFFNSSERKMKIYQYSEKEMYQ